MGEDAIIILYASVPGERAGRRPRRGVGLRAPRGSSCPSASPAAGELPQPWSSGGLRPALRRRADGGRGELSAVDEVVRASRGVLPVAERRAGGVARLW